MKRSVVVHPFLLAAYPVLFLFALNLHLFHVSAIIVPLVILLFVALLLLIALAFALKNIQKAGLVTSLFLLLLFSDESLLEAVRDSVARVDALVGLFIRLGIGPVRLHGILLASLIVIFCLGTCYLIRTRRSLQTVTLVTNVSASALVLMTLLDIAEYEVRVGSSWRSGGVVETTGVSLAEPMAPETLPDIYYIILDGYARADVLKDLYQHDNTDFLEYLSERGFYVASESRSNYCQTALSLASSLNMTYLDGLASQVGLESRDRRPPANMIWYSDVGRFLKHLGYTTVAFSTGWWGTEIEHADVYLSPRWEPDFFQRDLMEMTPLPFVIDQLGGVSAYDVHRERILYSFDHLADFTQQEAPVFVFAHVIIPHPPFVFGPDGEEITPDYRYSLDDASSLIGNAGFARDEYIKGYRDQLMFANRKLESALEAILSRSAEPPIIILQADHGPGSLLDWEDPENTYLKERMTILNAYYFPNGESGQLYDDITPVNTFRVVFNLCFGTDLELLPDESYFSTWSHPYAFINVTDEVTAGVGGS